MYFHQLCSFLILLAYREPKNTLTETEMKRIKVLEMVQLAFWKKYPAEESRIPNFYTFLQLDD